MSAPLLDTGWRIVVVATTAAQDALQATLADIEEKSLGTAVSIVGS